MNHQNSSRAYPCTASLLESMGVDPATVSVDGPRFWGYGKIEYDADGRRVYGADGLTYRRARYPFRPFHWLALQIIWPVERAVNV